MHMKERIFGFASIVIHVAYSYCYQITLKRTRIENIQTVPTVCMCKKKGKARVEAVMELARIALPGTNLF